MAFGGGKDGRSTDDLAGRRAQDLIDAAEKAAMEILDNAKASARRQIDGAHDEAIRAVQASDSRSPESSREREPLEEPRDDVREEPRDEVREEPRDDELDADASWDRIKKSGADAPSPHGESTQGRSAPSDGARLLATQMAVSGSNRDQIERRLGQEFGVEGAAEIVDSILGSEYE